MFKASTTNTKALTTNTKALMSCIKILMTCNIVWTYKKKIEQSHQSHNCHKPWIPFTKPLKFQDRLQESSNELQ
jgi:hypothetical protein